MLGFVESKMKHIIYHLKMNKMFPKRQINPFWDFSKKKEIVMLYLNGLFDQDEISYEHS